MFIATNAFDGQQVGIRAGETSGSVTIVKIEEKMVLRRLLGRLGEARGKMPASSIRAPMWQLSTHN